MNRYLEGKILMAEPVELICILYQSSIASIREAREHLRNGRISDRARAINRAYLMIEELAHSLNNDAAPALVGQLRDLYLYSERKLVEANSTQDDAPLAEVLGLLITLSEGWNGVPERRINEAIELAPHRSNGYPYSHANPSVMVSV